jgi:hypothetical protein
VWHPPHPAEPVKSALPAAAPAPEDAELLDDAELLEEAELLDEAELLVGDAAPGMPAWVTFDGGAPSGGAVLPFCAASQVWNVCGVTTRTGARIRPWPAPHNSVHSAG